MNVILNPDRTRKNVVSVDEAAARSEECPIDILPENIFIENAPPIPEGMHTPRLLENWRELLDMDPDAQVWEEANPAQRDADLFAAVVTRKMDEIRTAMDAALATGFTCTNGITMDATDEDARKLDAGSRLTARLGQATMDVRDHHNVRHPGIPLDEVDIMVNELGLNWLEKWNQKCGLQESVTAIVARTALPPTDANYLGHTDAMAELELI